jgi:hypothetical protein
MRTIVGMSFLSLAFLLCLGCGSTGSLLQSAIPLQIAPANVSPAIEGVAYQATLQASGGTSSYEWSVISGSLPKGLRLNPATGVISGTPTQSGTSSFSVSITESGVHPSASLSATVSITVFPRLVDTPPAPVVGRIGTPYRGIVRITGGVTPYKWSLPSGSLPPGLTISSGLIQGVPTKNGNYNFTVQVTDSGSLTQTIALPMTITVAPPLALAAPGLTYGTVGTAYSGTPQATGGTPPYSWSISSGSLPAGLSLSSSTGTISGTPTAAGWTNFSVQVTDSSSPAQVASSVAAILVAPSPLAITSAALPSGTSGTAYAASLAATGGTPAYSWSVTSGSLPAGLTLAGTTGVISGTPTVSGTSSFTVTVRDNGSPAQVQSTLTAITLAAAPQAPVAGTTWYVRPDGGSRFSKNMFLGQCDGKGDAPYPGLGVNQHCAFSDVRFLWQDGSYTTDNTQASFPSYGWIGSGGDTYIIRGSIGTGVSYRVGWSNPNYSWDPNQNLFMGVQGNPYGSGAPVPLSGTAGQHTRILGENYASCHDASAKTQLHGGFGVNVILPMNGASYVDVACLDITDYSSCGRDGQANSCNTSIGALSDFAGNGISWANNSTNDTLTDVHIHGMGEAGMIGPTGTGMVFSYLDILGNASSGWNADAGDGSTGTGSLLVQHFNISWNGCAEEYPAVDALPYGDCTDDSSGGYGDGFGTASVMSNPGWTVHFDQGTASYNTQDGLDALHMIGNGSSMTVTRTLAYGNMGQQIKVGGASGSAINNVIVTNCNALRQAIPGTPAGYNVKLGDFCRAADTGVLLTVGVNTTLHFNYNTIYSASQTAVEIECDGSAGPCDSTSKIDYRNNIFVGFLNSVADGYPPSQVTNNYSNPIYDGTGVGPFTNPGSFYTNNSVFNPKSNWNCATASGANAICGDPGLVDETWHLYGYGTMSPASASSAVMGAGMAIPSVTIDYAGQTRPNPPSIGAYQE